MIRTFGQATCVWLLAAFAGFAVHLEPVAELVTDFAVPAAHQFFIINMFVLLFAILGGWAFGIPTILALATNGLLFGWIMPAIAAINPNAALVLVAPHGILEVPALWIGGAVGFRIAAAERNRERIEKTRGIMAAVALAIGMTAVAAWIESAVTPRIFRAVVITPENDGSMIVDAILVLARVVLSVLLPLIVLYGIRWGARPLYRRLARSTDLQPYRALLIAAARWPLALISIGVSALILAAWASAFPPNPDARSYGLGLVVLVLGSIGVSGMVVFVAGHFILRRIEKEMSLITDVPASLRWRYAGWVGAMLIALLATQYGSQAMLELIWPRIPEMVGSAIGISLYLILLIVLGPYTMAWLLGGDVKATLRPSLRTFLRDQDLSPDMVGMLGEDTANWANGLATGISPARGRILLTAGLLDCLNDAELNAVVAHEIGHLRKHHLLKMLGILIIMGAILAGPFAFGLNLITDSMPEIVAPLVLGGGVMIFILVPFLLVIGLVFRQFEYDADTWAADAMGSPLPLASALEKLHAVADYPDRWKGFLRFWLTHPDLTQRLTHLGLSAPIGTKSQRIETEDANPAMNSVH